MALTSRQATLSKPRQKRSIIAILLRWQRRAPGRLAACFLPALLLPALSLFLSLTSLNSLTSLTALTALTSHTQITRDSINNLVLTLA